MTLAIARLVAALREFPILGIRTNVPFLLRVLDHPRFRAGEIDTGFLDAKARFDRRTVARREPPRFVLPPWPRATPTAAGRRRQPPHATRPGSVDDAAEMAGDEKGDEVCRESATASSVVEHEAERDRLCRRHRRRPVGVLERRMCSAATRRAGAQPAAERGQARHALTAPMPATVITPRQARRRGQERRHR